MKLNLVPARTGLAWFRAGLRTFWRQPLAFSGLFLLFIAIVSLVSMLPVVGGVLALTLLPAATLGFMAATREATLGKFPMPAILLSAFRAGRQRARAMLMLGVAYALGLVLVLGVSALADGGQFARMYLFGGPITVELANSSAFRSAVWISMALYVPLNMLFWHAPALVHWHDVPPARGLFFSFVACARNFWAFTLYTLAWSGLGLLVAFGLILLTALLGSPQVLGVALMPVSLLMGAMFITSIWFSFHDSFVVSDETTDSGAASAEA
ncbi:BPSS1780 family membrane protein [Hylemonella sp. W303a]|uniref:BPSS1780 family membrane protein n=1 Tax=Hylemonella sp. W303a TaxID=3389873 RepID=UPI00396B4437